MHVLRLLSVTLYCLYCDNDLMLTILWGVTIFTGTLTTMTITMTTKTVNDNSENDSDGKDKNENDQIDENDDDNHDSNIGDLIIKSDTERNLQLLAMFARILVRFLSSILNVLWGFRKNHLQPYWKLWSDIKGGYWACISRYWSPRPNSFTSRGGARFSLGPTLV